MEKIAYLANIHDWKRVLQFYVAWLRRIEMGLNSWQDDSSLIKNVMLFNKPFGKKLGKEGLKSEQICQVLNKNKCLVQSASHQPGSSYLSHLLAKR